MEFPYLTPDIPGIGGEVKKTPEDFRVEEVPLYEPSGEGTHLYIRVEKIGVSTLNAAAHIAKTLGIRADDVGFAGLKDVQAVAVQTFSVEHSDEESVRKIENEDIRILSISRHTNKLRKGHLQGNKFKIRVRNADASKAGEAVEILRILGERGMPNYFGPQRFGYDRRNHETGRQLLQSGRRRLRPKEQIILNAFQSYFFNLILGERIQTLDKLFEGDFAYLHRNGAVFKVADPAVEEPRLRSFEISPSGVLYGYKTPLAEGMQGEIERRVLADSGVPEEDWKKSGLRGERRALRVKIENIEYGWEGDAFNIAFYLPSGSYATIVLRELMKSSDPNVEF
jgi:tRNA pseudouridine13 synthase